MSVRGLTHGAPKNRTETGVSAASMSGFVRHPPASVPSFTGQVDGIKPSFHRIQRNQNLSSFPPEALVELLRCLYIMSQRISTEMEPSVARTTNIHSAGLSGVPGSSWGGRPVDLSWTSATKNTSEGYRLMNNLQKNVCLML